ncbi:hypothetical protein [Aquimarina sp. 2201CG5-10]|uniref:hypothetical protein n=1 Tax=Aquimarina callyspongiae TaxID=3098150 RepID=UPI002AB54661|nr:hypothetical protein [Aquimarina sp. 2201CG5-10]MDY8134858.1 hypothetical protein [Aquimarina sp. 2201CG5-10]
MSQEVIKKIALLVFEKAKKELGNHTKNAICNHISDKLDQNPDIQGSLDPKTIKRVYEKYVEDKQGGTPSEITITYLTQFLGYQNYGDFIKKTSNPAKESKLIDKKISSPKKKIYKKTFIVLSALLIIATGITFSFWGSVHITSEQEKEIIVFLINKNHQTELGKLTVENDYSLHVWLPKGKAELYYYSLDEKDGKEYPGAEIIEVLPFWRSISPVVLSKI